MSLNPHRSREAHLTTLKALGNQVCQYTQTTWPDNLCDCKYGLGLTDRPNGEQVGCPELRDVVEALEAMTDDQWLTLISAPGATALFETRTSYEDRRFNELPRHLQAEATARTMRQVWTEVLAGNLRFTGEPLEQADFEKRLNARFDRYVGEVVDDRIEGVIKNDPDVVEIVREEAERRVWAQRHVVVPRDRMVLRG